MIWYIDGLCVGGLCIVWYAVGGLPEMWPDVRMMVQCGIAQKRGSLGTEQGKGLSLSQMMLIELLLLLLLLMMMMMMVASQTGVMVVLLLVHRVPMVMIVMIQAIVIREVRRVSSLLCATIAMTVDSSLLSLRVQWRLFLMSFVEVYRCWYDFPGILRM